jgi:hypothetical protein
VRILASTTGMSVWWVRFANRWPVPTAEAPSGVNQFIRPDLHHFDFFFGFTDHNEWLIVRHSAGMNFSCNQCSSQQFWRCFQLMTHRFCFHLGVWLFFLFRVTAGHSEAGFLPLFALGQCTHLNSRHSGFWDHWNVIHFHAPNPSVLVLNWRWNLVTVFYWGVFQSMTFLR